MIYKGVDTDNKGKAIICPRCKNEEIESNGVFCKVCGVSLINTCAETDEYLGNSVRVHYPCEEGKILPSNARFCPYCGNQSSFFQNKILQAWDAFNSGSDEDNELLF